MQKYLFLPCEIYLNFQVSQLSYILAFFSLKFKYNKVIDILSKFSIQIQLTR